MSIQLGLFEAEENKITDSMMELFQKLYPTKAKIQAHYIESVSNLQRSYMHHEDIIANGTSDPTWPDGCNANLVRNHILAAKRGLKVLHEVYGYPLPAGYFLPVPKKINPNAMFNNRKIISELNLYWDGDEDGD
jgi:hypothetical protein